MIKAVDTNILVRSFVRDDLEQTKRANAEMSSGDVLISHSVLIEAEWVLRSRYNWPRRDVARALAGLLDFANIHIEDSDLVGNAITLHAEGADFADVMHLVGAKNADEFVTFDLRLAKLDSAGTLPIRLA